MKTLSLLVLTIFIAASCAHNRIQFGAKYKHDRTEHTSIQPETVDLPSDSIELAPKQTVVAEIQGIRQSDDLDRSVSTENRINFKRPFELISQQMQQIKTNQLLIKSMHRSSMNEQTNSQIAQNVRKGKILFAIGMTLTAFGVIALSLALVFLLTTSAGIFEEAFVIIGIVFAALAAMFLIAGIILAVIGRKMYRTVT